MPRVPYQPYSDVVPSTANVNIDAQPEAFGATVAREVEKTGGEIGDTGDRLFQRAVAFQQLANETEAEQANVKFMSAAGDLHAKYDALQGQERVDAFPQYKQNLLKLQSSIRGSLSNDAARRAFDPSSLNVLRHSIFNAAGAAATAQRQAVGDTAAATTKLLSNQSSQNPDDDVLWERTRNGIITAANKEAWAKKGVDADSPVAQEHVRETISKAVRERITAVVHNNQWEQAARMQQEANKRGDLQDTDNLALDNIIKTERRAAGAANIANDIYVAGQPKGDQPGASAKEMEEQVRSVAKDTFGNDTIAVEHAVTALQARIAKENRINAIQRAKDTQTIWEAINAREPTNIQELRDSGPDVKAAIDNLPAKQQAALARDIEKQTHKRDVAESDRNYKRLLGMADEDPMRFLETHLPDEKLTTSQYKSLLAVRDKKIKNPGDDPRVTRAMGWLKDAYGNTMDRLGIASSKGDNQAYYEFRGSLLQALEAEQERNKRGSTREEVVDKMWPILTKNLSFPGRVFGTNEYPLWKPPTYAKTGYEDFADKQRRDAATLGIDITEEQIKNHWVRLLYQKEAAGKGGK